MKKLLPILFMAMLFCKVALSNEFNWTKIATTVNGSLETYFDKKSIKKIENYKYVWILSNVLKDADKVKSFVVYEKVNCSNNQMQNIIWIEYSDFFAKGEIGYHEVSQDEYLEWTSADPSSVMEIIVNETCNFKSTAGETESSINPDENKPKNKKMREKYKIF